MTEQIRFNEAMVELAREMMVTIHSLPGIDNNWQDAYIDARFAPEGGCSLDKFRLNLRNGSTISVETTAKIDILLKELWELRPFCLNNSWYGLIIIISPSGECRIKFNFDPNCIADSHFFVE